MITLDGVWEFQHDPAGNLTPAGLGPMRPIQVPAPWQAQFDDLRLVSGVGWYRRLFSVPSAWREGVILLHFGAVDYYAEIWLNGRRVGDHEGGYLPFDFEIQDYLRDDPANELIVRVVDPGPDTAEQFPEFRFGDIPHGKQNWYGPVGGIWQSVYVEPRCSTYVARLRVTAVQSDRQTSHHRSGEDLGVPEQDARVEPRHSGSSDSSENTAQSWTVHVAASIQHPRASLAVRFRIFAPDGSLVAETGPMASADDVAETDVAVNDPELWDIDHPALYRVEAALLDGDNVVDRREDTFGFRTIQTRDGQIWLNGRPIYLRGALDQDYYPGTICAPPSDDFIRDRFLKAKELGLNCLRCHIKVPDPRYYAWADRLGILVWTDLPSWGARPGLGGGYGPRSEIATERAMATLRGMVERDWNHPSLICWSIVNEDWGTKLLTSAEDRRWLATAYDAAKALDPFRLVVDNSACAPNFHVKSDLDDYHFYRAIPDHAREWSATIADFASRAAWSYSQHGDAVRTGREPLVVSEFGNWGLPDVNRIIEANGGEPWWFDTGSNWGAARVRGLVHPRGVLERFLALGLDRVFGSYEAFIRASQEQEHEALRFEIEEMRRRDSIQGYVITELTDVHWECNGLLDLYNHPKSFQRTLARINADDVIVPALDPPDLRVFWSGESVALDVVASVFSRQSLADASVHWRLAPPTGPEANAGAVASGESGAWSAGKAPAAGLEPGHATKLQHLEFRAPATDAPTQVTLNLDLRDANGAAFASNSTALFVVPRAFRRANTGRNLALFGPAAPVAAVGAALADLGYRLGNAQTADVLVGRGVTPDLLSAVEAGGRGLAVIGDRSAVNGSIEPLDIVDRAGSGYEGDWASSFSWLYPEHFQPRLPSGPRLDWAFASVTPEAVILGLSPEEIAQNALAALFLGWIQKPAALAVRIRVGAGTLLVTTLRLFEPRGRPFGEDPAATVLFHDLVESLLADQRRPTIAIRVP